MALALLITYWSKESNELLSNQPPAPKETKNENEIELAIIFVCLTCLLISVLCVDSTAS